MEANNSSLKSEGVLPADTEEDVLAIIEAYGALNTMDNDTSLSTAYHGVWELEIIGSGNIDTDRADWSVEVTMADD